MTRQAENPESRETVYTGETEATIVCGDGTAFALEGGPGDFIASDEQHMRPPFFAFRHPKKRALRLTYY